MLDKPRLIGLFDHLGIPSKGQELVREARIKAPVREVKSRGSNVVTIFVSRKMAREIRTESRHIEFAAALNHEFDPAVLEFYPQPCKLHMELIDDATGEIHPIHHTPDFLVLRADGVTLEEWKSDDKLAGLAKRYPYRYQRDSDGNWCAPKIQEHLAEMGIDYRICTDRSIPRMRVENLLHLADYYHPAAPPCEFEELERLRSALQSEGMLFLADLTNPPYRFTADFLFKAIADDLVVADINNEPLTDQRRCKLYRDVTYLEFASALSNEGDVLGKHNFVLELANGTRFQYRESMLEIVLVAETDLICRDEHGNTVPLTRKWLLQAHEEKQITVLQGPDSTTLDLARYSEQELEQALKRQAILQADDGVVSERTRRDWRARIDTAAANGGNQALALVPRTAARGNRSARFSDEQESLLEQVIRQRWTSTEAINFTALYHWVCIAFADADLKAPSYPTVVKRVQTTETTNDVRVRYGKRKAYQLDEFVNVLYADTPIHGSRAFQYVHIDHTLLDIELISHRTGEPLGRPWVSMAIDANTRRNLAFYLTFDPPSYLSVLMLMRDMVRRFQRLPEMIIVDNGRDLTSGAFRSFLQVMGVHLRLRPVSKPRVGSVMERIFGVAHSQYVHNLAGNTKATKDVRTLTGKHLPVNLAQWTLESMYYGFGYWAFEYYDTKEHPALASTPRKMFERSLAQSGQRTHRHIVWNEDFLIATCPPVDRGALRQVNNQRGVKVNNYYYWHSIFRDPKIAGKKLSVRADPWDASTVYVRANDRWVAAKCRALVGLGQLTEAERRAMTEEYRRRSPNKPLDDPLAPQRMREFMQVFTPEGALATARDRQQENKCLYNALGLSTIKPVPPLQVRQLLEDRTMDLDLLAFQPDDASPEPLATEQTYPIAPANPPGALDIPEFDDF